MYLLYIENLPDFKYNVNKPIFFSQLLILFLCFYLFTLRNFDDSHQIVHVLKLLVKVMVATALVIKDNYRGYGTNYQKIMQEGFLLATDLSRNGCNTYTNALHFFDGRLPLRPSCNFIMTQSFPSYYSYRK